MRATESSICRGSAVRPFADESAPTKKPKTRNRMQTCRSGFSRDAIEEAAQGSGLNFAFETFRG
jgi:hypothetical protein